MKIMRAIRIALHTEERLTIRSAASNAELWCEQCAGRTCFVPVEQVIPIACVSPKTLQEWVAGRAVHTAEGPAGSLLVCLNSLVTQMNKFEKEKPACNEE